ncbi:MAG: nitroreductase/quinone reductase family protein [bacterium]
MKALKIVGILFLIYVGIVVAFETWLGIAQPYGEGMMIITTTAENGERKPRVVSRLESDGKLYVAANHWPRAWYNQVLDNPDVTVTIDEVENPYRAVAVSGAEHDQIDAEHALPTAFRILTGFPPRYFIRLDPLSSDS